MLKKKLYLIALVLSVTVFIFGGAAAEDGVFTCASNPADFTGKTFENLTLELGGCKNLRSDILEEDNVLLLLDDVTVTGYVYYKDGQDTADHHIVFINSDLANMIVPCSPTHECYVAFDNHDPLTWAPKLSVLPTGEDKGKIHVRGIVTPYMTALQNGTKMDEMAWYENYSLMEEQTGTQLTAATMELQFIVADLGDEKVFKLIMDDYQKNALDMFMPDTMEDYNPFEEAGLDSDYYEEIEGNVEVELSHIVPLRTEVVNEKVEITPVLSHRGPYVNMPMLAVNSPNLDMYLVPHPTDPNYVKEALNRIYVDMMISAVKGSTFNFRGDSVFVNVLHFFGNNDPDSKLSVTSNSRGCGNLGISNLFLLGSDLEATGDSALVQFDRVMVFEQPKNYGLLPSRNILDNYLKEHMTEYVNPIDAVCRRYTGENCKNDLSSFYSEYGVNMMDLYARDLRERYQYESETIYDPHIKLINATIGKALFSKSMFDTYDRNHMVQLIGSSRINGQDYAYIWSVGVNGITDELAATPRWVIDWRGLECLPADATPR